MVIIILSIPHWPCPIADKSIQLCGTQRLGFSCRAKARVGWVGGRAFMEISVVLSQHRFQTNQNNCHYNPSKPPFLPTTTHMICDQSSLLCWKCSQIRSGAVAWRRGSAACAPGAIVEKVLTVSTGSHLIGENIGRSNSKSWGSQARSAL